MEKAAFLLNVLSLKKRVTMSRTYWKDNWCIVIKTDKTEFIALCESGEIYVLKERMIKCKNFDEVLALCPELKN